MRLQRLLAKDPGGNALLDHQYAYDAVGRITGMLDGRGKLWSTTYDPATGQQAATIDPNNHRISYSYTPEGLLDTVTDANRYQTSYIYNADQQISEIHDPETGIIQYGYDPDGNLDHIWDQEQKEISYAYDPQGRVTTILDGKGQELAFTYGVPTPSGATGGTSCPTCAASEDDEERLLSITAPTFTKMFQYDAQGRVAGEQVLNGTTLMDEQYQYDRAQNVAQKITPQGNYGYAYDGLSRLTSASAPGQAAVAYTYDTTGNRLTQSGIAGTWAYNANSELLAYGDATLTYDANGNLTEHRVAGALVRKYVYNADNRLIRVEDGSGATLATYYYDPFGRRLWKEVNGVKTYFLYIDEGLAAEYDANGNELRSYGYRPHAEWTADPVWLKENGQYYFYQNDYLGTPRILTDLAGTVVWSARYDAFGQGQVEVETVVNNFRLPGQYYDAETGLHYNWHRYYDPDTGRYLNRDPSASNVLNPYPYAQNNPLKWIDANGLEVVDGLTGAAQVPLDLSIIDLQLNQLLQTLIDNNSLPDTIKNHPIFIHPNNQRYHPDRNVRIPDPDAYYLAPTPFLPRPGGGYIAYEGHLRLNWIWKVPRCTFDLLHGHYSDSPHFILYEEPCSGACIYSCYSAGSPPYADEDWHGIPKQYQPKQISTTGSLFDADDINTVYPQSAMKEYCLPPLTRGSRGKEGAWQTKYTMIKAINYFIKRCEQGKSCFGCCDNITFRTHIFRGTDYEIEYQSFNIDLLTFSIPCHTGN